MTCSVLQTGLEPPTSEQLQRAFQQVPGLAAADVFSIGRGAFGILGRSLDSEQADRLKSALAAEGLETEVVDDTQVPALPDMRNVYRLESTPAALMIYDPLGRGFALAWKDVLIIAAGQVRMSDFKTIEVARISYDRRGRKLETMERRGKEEQNDHWLVEIVITGGALRYSVTVDRPGSFLFQYLGDRRTRNMQGDIQLVVQDLTSHAPNAAVNRGAYCLRENFPQPFRYPSKTVFFNELIWLLWKMK